MRSVLYAVAACAVFAVACEKKTQPPTSTESAPPPAPSAATDAPAAETDDQPILIGEVGSLTGAEATFGVSTHHGVEMAIEEANAAGGVKGRKVAVRVYDDQSKPEEAANAVTRLIAQDKVKLILGEVASSNSLAMAPKAQEAKVPMITPASTNPAVTEKGDYIFRVCFIDPFQGYVMAKFARDTLKLEKVAVLKDNKSDYSLGLTEVFTKKFPELGGKITAVESYSKGDSDFRSQLTRIRGQKPQAIYVPGYYSDVGIIAKQAKELGLKVPLMGGDGWDSPKLFELAGSNLDGSYFSNHYSPENPDPLVQKFLTDYKKKHGSVPDAMAALGYDATRVAIDAMKRATDLSGAALRDAIGQTKNFPGVAGTITLDDKRNAVKPAVVMQVVDSKYKYVATVEP